MKTILGILALLVVSTACSGSDLASVTGSQRPTLKGGAIALVLVIWVAALVSQLSLFGAERGHPRTQAGRHLPDEVLAPERPMRQVIFGRPEFRLPNGRPFGLVKLPPAWSTGCRVLS